jgi:hypothetical protein
VTPKEIAKIIRQLFGAMGFSPEPMPKTVDEAATILERIMNHAVAAERERCAKVAEGKMRRAGSSQYSAGWSAAAKQIRKILRAGEEPKQDQVSQ